jgi:hypothetical protein
VWQKSVLPSSLCPDGAPMSMCRTCIGHQDSRNLSTKCAGNVQPRTVSGVSSLLHMVCCRSLFNFALPNLPFVPHPECAFSLNYSQKWLLEMSSPLILALALLLFIGLRYAH